MKLARDVCSAVSFAIARRLDRIRLAHVAFEQKLMTVTATIQRFL